MSADFFDPDHDEKEIPEGFTVRTFKTDDRIRVYTASKIAKAPFWKELAARWQEVNFISRWVHFHVGHTPDTPAFAKLFWIHDHEDVRSCDALILYGDPDEKLRGGLVEAGMALAMQKTVIVVGKHDDYGTWQYHPNVYRCETFDDARVLLRALTVTPIED